MTITWIVKTEVLLLLIANVWSEMVKKLKEPTFDFRRPLSVSIQVK